MSKRTTLALLGATALAVAFTAIAPTTTSQAAVDNGFTSNYAGSSLTIKAKAVDLAALGAYYLPTVKNTYAPQTVAAVDPSMAKMKSVALGDLVKVFEASQVTKQSVALMAADPRMASKPVLPILALADFKNKSPSTTAPFAGADPHGAAPASS